MQRLWVVLALSGVAACGLLGGSSNSNNNNNNGTQDMAMQVERLTLSPALEKNSNFHGMFVLDGDHIWIGADDGVVWRLTTGWESSTVTTAVNTDITSLYFLTAQHGFAGTGHGNDGTLIFETTDGGATWTNQQVLPGAQSDVKRMLFTDAQHGLAVTGVSTGKIYRTQDAGQSWQEVMGVDYASTYVQLADIAAGPDGTIWVSGSRDQQSKALLLKSSDGGSTWSMVDNNGDLMIFDIDPWENGELWATSFGGVLHSTDNGANWTRTNPDPQNAPTSAVTFASDRQRGIATRGNAAFLYTTADGGQSWSYMQYNDQFLIYSFTDVWVGPNNVGYILGDADRSSKGVLLRFQLP